MEDLFLFLHAHKEVQLLLHLCSIRTIPSFTDYLQTRLPPISGHDYQITQGLKKPCVIWFILATRNLLFWVAIPELKAYTAIWMEKRTMLHPRGAACVITFSKCFIKRDEFLPFIGWNFPLKIRTFFIFHFCLVNIILQFNIRLKNK